MGESVMNEYDRQLEQEMIATAHIAAMERARLEREAAARRHILELEEVILHQPNDFAD
jgi:hypothetical protein